MKSKIILIALVISAYACSNPSPQGDGSVKEVMVGGNKVLVCLFDKVKSETVTAPLSRFVEHFEIVQLETCENAFFNTTANITVTEKYIGVRPIYGDNYTLFDRAGKFFCTVSRKGRGPGEYPISINDDIIDEKNGIIYLALTFSNKLLVYNTSGQFLKEFVLPHRFDQPKIFLSEGTLAVVQAPIMFQQPNRTINQADVMMVKFDVKTGEMLEQLAPPYEHLILKSLSGFPNTFRNVPDVFDWFPNYQSEEHIQCDTIYHIDIKRNKLIPFFTVEANNLANENFKPFCYQVNKNLILINLFKFKGPREEPKDYYIAADLKSKISTRFNKVANDYLGNMIISRDDFHLKITNGYYTTSIQPEDLMEDIEKRLKESSCTQKDREILKKTLSTLKEGTNNVVFIGKIKDEIKTNLW